MENYSPLFGVRWPTPGTFGIILGLALLFISLIIYLIYKYLEAKEQTRIHNYQLFLFQAKRKGLNNFQFKILKNMASYLKLSNPKELVSNSALFESTLSDFIEYLKKQTEGEENLAGIFRDLTTIYERLYIAGTIRKPLESMADIEDGEILYFTAESGEVYLGKAVGRGGDFIALKIFTPAKNLKNFEDETPVSLHLLRINDAEYLARTVTMGIDVNTLLVKFSDDFIREREFRHPYINVVIPGVVTIPSLTGAEEPEQIECSILKINEYECVLRIPSPLEYGREYPISFEISKYRFNVNSRIVSSKTVETESVYYLTFKFLDMTDPGKVILTRYIAESMQ
jgi:hypothetical protein